MTEVPQSFSDLPSDSYVRSVADNSAVLRPNPNIRDNTSSVWASPYSRFGARKHSQSVIDLSRPTLASLHQESDPQKQPKKVWETLNSMPLEVIGMYAFCLERLH